MNSKSIESVKNVFDKQTIKNLEMENFLKTYECLDKNDMRIKELFLVIKNGSTGTYTRYENREKIIKINMVNENLIKIPETIKEFPNLKRLDLHNNQIEKIENLEKSFELDTIILNNNNIKKISGLNNCKKLKYINLDNNQIEVIEGIDKLKELNYLYFNDNPLKYSKYKELKMTGLEILTKEENSPFVDIPENFGQQNVINQNKAKSDKLLKFYNYYYELRKERIINKRYKPKHRELLKIEKMESHKNNSIDKEVNFGY